MVRGFHGGTAGRSVQYCTRLISLGVCLYLARRELPSMQIVVEGREGSRLGKE